MSTKDSVINPIAYRVDEISPQARSNGNGGNKVDQSPRGLIPLNIESASDVHDEMDKDLGPKRNWNRMETASTKASTEFQAADNNRWSKLAVSASWAVNWLLLIIKTLVPIYLNICDILHDSIYCRYVFAVSGSKSVLAALVDSAVDLASQAVLSLSELYINKHSPYYPVGRSRLEALSVIASAFIMMMASIEVIQFSIVDIIDGVDGQIPPLDISLASYTILAIVVLLKLALYVYCKWANSLLKMKSDTMEALAEDHLNDVFSNVVAIICASIAFSVRFVTLVYSQIINTS